MPKDDTSESEPEQTPENSSSDLEEPVTPVHGQHQDGVSEYEKQRLSRIAENKARLESLGLRKMASLLTGSARNSRKNKGKAKVVDKDGDYMPEEEGPSSSTEEEEEGNDDDDDDEEDYLGGRSSGSNKKKLKNKGLTSKKKVPARKQPGNSDYIDDDEALRQAIALSLQSSAEVSSVVHDRPSDKVNSNIDGRKGKTEIQEDTGRKNKRKKSFASRLQMTEDELVVHFFQFDEEWKGGISFRDIKRVATAHDFTWNDKELADMVNCFDSDGDRKLSLDDFREIATRCKIIKESEDS
ncbi:hypothetical protein FNV43_RR18304 [Rhamnella rubrinervis]|uniref:EF-hand domain-containing protein n=1 Tax=Rhamnella rubrinervis TaxID=2594499 RepID=A0A8K0E4C0_9ROSA|nr:hypothetical protein FNV43_RR18304 [Rhamnella rubrinervis]